MIKWLVRLFVLLLCGIAPPVAQSQDSTFSTQQAVWTERQAQVKHWKQMQDTALETLDSVKKKFSVERGTPDSTELDSALVFLDQKKKDISRYIYEIQTARETWLPIAVKTQIAADSMTETDSLAMADRSLEADSLEADSLRNGRQSLTDTLPELLHGYELLIEDVTDLERWISRQREEIATADVDSTAVARNPAGKRMVSAVQTNLGKDGSSSGFFDYPAWSSRLFLMLISVLYFYWIFKLGRKTEQADEEFRLYQNEPLWIPCLKGAIFFLVLLPFASFTIPVLVLEGSFLLIFAFLYLILYKELSTTKRRLWVMIFISYLLLITANLFLSTLWWTKAFAVLTSVLSIAVVWSMERCAEDDSPIRPIHRYARWGIILAHVVAIVLNIMGYISFSRMWSLAAGISLLQIIALRAVRDMLLHDIEQQYNRVKSDALLRRFDLKGMLLRFDRLFRFCSALLIVLALLNNFHLIREAISLFEHLLLAEHKIGGVTFTYANLLLALTVIWLANGLQKSLKNLLDDTSPKNELQVRKMTLFPLLRLLIIVIGFLIGISILGVGMDKLTVIIGALSVGIGLGLQNVINNFVSGIILVFEKPFKIGDYVELADKKGQVMEIGIRSSTLLTDEGARVIIPNGDLLSGRLVNWTFRDADIRVNLLLTVDNTVPIEEVRKELRTKLLTFEEIDHSIPMKIFTKEITADNYQLTMQVGIKNVRYIERFRSRFLESFKNDMTARGATVSSG